MKTKLALNFIGILVVMFCNLDLVTTGRPITAVVITVAVVLVGL